MKFSWLLVIIACVILSVGVVVFVRNKTSDYEITFADRETLRFETSSKDETLSAFQSLEILDDPQWREWMETEGNTLFGDCLAALREIEYPEREFHPKYFSVTPLFMAVILHENNYPFDCQGANAPVVCESYVYLIENTLANTAYFVGREYSLGGVIRRRAWVPGVDLEKKEELTCCKINADSDFDEQLTHYLKSISFGPNQWWSPGRCVSLRVFCEEAERSHFTYPLIDERKKRESQKEYEKVMPIYADSSASPEAKMNNRKIIIEGNKEAYIERIMQWPTYAGLLEGLPTIETNQWHMESAVAEAKKICYQDEIYLIEPEQTLIPYDRKYPPGTPASIPGITCIAKIEYDSSFRDENMDYSSLGIVWFQSDYAFPIDENILQKIKEIPFGKLCHEDRW